MPFLLRFSRSVAVLLLLAFSLLRPDADVHGQTTTGARSPVVLVYSFTYTGNDPVFAAPLPDNSYRNPILAGFYPDPSLCRVGDDYYLVNSTFAYFPGIPIFHSHDLVHWTQIGHVIARPTQLKYDALGVSRGIFAPTLRYHDGTFYLVCTMVDAGGNFVMTAKDPAGPWSDPVWLSFEGIDPSLFFDDDGRAWLVNNGAPEGKPLYDGERAIWLQSFDAATLHLTGPRIPIVVGGTDLAQNPIWIEGPHLYRRQGWCYLCCAEGGTGDRHSQVIFRSKAVTGPYVAWRGNPILTQRDLDGTAPGAITCTGHADLTIGPDGNWWAVFLGCRPDSGGFYHTGRETFLLPVRWTDDGWPVILPPGHRVPYVVPAPSAPTYSAKTGESAPAIPLTGNFTWQDDFRAPQLAPSWIMLRAPRKPWWQTGRPGGGLAVVAQMDPLWSAGQPSFLARRIQHTNFSATILLDVPSTPGVSAGLAAFQNETHHYFFGVRRTPSGATVFVERLNGKAPVSVATLELVPHSPVALRIACTGPDLTFFYANGGDDWHVLASHADATVLSTQVAGGFVGAVVGIHARIEP